MALTVWKKKMAALDNVESTADWQLSCDGMLQRGNFLFNSSLWADCAFLVGPTQTPIRAHRFILAMASPVFETMFYGSIPEGLEPIPIPDIDPIVFMEMLRYIYTDNVIINSISTAFELHYCAKKYMLPFLVRACTEHLDTTLSAHSVLPVYEHAKFYDERTLLGACLAMMKTKTTEILNTPSFVEARLETVITLFGLDSLNIESEIQLFEAAERYSRAQETKNEDDDEPTYNVVGSLAEPASPDVVIKSPEYVATTIDEDLEIIELPTLTIEIGSSDEDQRSVVPRKRRRRMRRKKAEDAGEGTSKAEKEVPAAVVSEKQQEKPTIRSAIQQIRFLTLTPPELAKCEVASRMLTRTEIFAILMNISSEDTYEPMPVGFSTSRMPRNQPYLSNAIWSSDQSTVHFFTGLPERSQNTVPGTPGLAERAQVLNAEYVNERNDPNSRCHGGIRHRGNLQALRRPPNVIAPPRPPEERRNPNEAPELPQIRRYQLNQNQPQQDHIRVPYRVRSPVTGRIYRVGIEGHWLPIIANENQPENNNQNNVLDDSIRDYGVRVFRRSPGPVCMQPPAQPQPNNQPIPHQIPPQQAPQPPPPIQQCVYQPWQAQNVPIELTSRRRREDRIRPWWAPMMVRPPRQPPAPAAAAPPAAAPPAVAPPAAAPPAANFRLDYL